MQDEEKKWLDLDDDPKERDSRVLTEEERPEQETAQEPDTPDETPEEEIHKPDHRTTLVLGFFVAALLLAIAALAVLNMPGKETTLELPQTTSDGATINPSNDPYLKQYDESAEEIAKALIEGQHTVISSDGNELMMTFDTEGSYTGPDEKNPVAYGTWELSMNDSTIHVTYQDGSTADFAIGQDSRGNITLTASWGTYTFEEN